MFREPKLILSVPAESQNGETRVAMTPRHVSRLLAGLPLFKEIRIHQDAGTKSGFSANSYRRAGARIVQKLETLYAGANIALRVKRAAPDIEAHEVKLWQPGMTVVGFLDPQVKDRSHLNAYAAADVNAYSFELMPQTLQTLSMHATAAMSKITGHVVIAEAAAQLTDLKGKNVLVIGMGNAGLAAIKEARLQGANVTALSTTNQHEAELRLLGAGFHLLQDERNGTMSAHDALDLQRKRIADFLPDANVIVCSARRVGQPAPLLITTDMQSAIKPGTLVFDLTKSSGAGNFEGGVYGEDSIIGNCFFCSKKGYPKAVPEAASPMYATCASKFLRALLSRKRAVEPTQSILTTCVTAGGFVNPICIPGINSAKFAETAFMQLMALRGRARG